MTDPNVLSALKKTEKGRLTYDRKWWKQGNINVNQMCFISLVKHYIIARILGVTPLIKGTHHQLLLSLTLIFKWLEINPKYIPFLTLLF